MTKIKFNKWILDLPEYIPGRTIEEIKKAYGLKQVHKLASNENILGPAPQVIDFLKGSYKDINYYPDSYCLKIRKRLSEVFHVDPDSIIMGNGTDQIIEMICDALLDSSKNVVVSDPTFLTYEKSALKCNASVKKVPLRGFRQDMDSLSKAIDQDTAIVFLTSPHNPTGTMIQKEELDIFLDEAGKDILVVLDEAYYEYMTDGEKVDTLRYLDEHKNLVLLRTFSKIYGLAGLRIGYGISDREIISNISKLSQPFNVNSIAQEAAVIALDNQDYIREVMKKNNSEKAKFYDVLSANKINYIVSYANFILIETGKGSSAVAEGLLRKGFIVRLGDFLGVKGFIRVSVSTPEVNDRFLDAFLKIFNKYAN
jgi:histidinol-phosphate aminotransferase